MRNTFKNFIRNEFPLQRLKTKTEANSSEYNLRTRAAKPEEINRSLSPEQVQAEKRKNNENIGDESKKKKLNHEKDKKNLECFHCDASNKNSKEIFDHWTNTHKRNGISPFLFQIGQPSITLTNMELNRLLAINNPSKTCHSRSKARRDGIDPKTSSKIFHSNTKVIFSNALVLTKHNLSTTRLGDCEKDKFISTLLNIRPKVTINAGGDKLRTEIVQPIVSSTNRGSTEQNKQKQGVNARNSIADSKKADSFISTLFNIKSEVIDDGNNPSTVPPSTKTWQTPSRGPTQSTNQMQIPLNVKNEVSCTDANSKTIDKNIDTQLNKNIKTERVDDTNPSSSFNGNLSPTVSHQDFELKKELRNTNSMNIVGILQRDNEELHDIFSRICQRLQINIKFKEMYSKWFV